MMMVQNLNSSKEGQVFSSVIRTTVFSCANIIAKWFSNDQLANTMCHWNTGVCQGTRRDLNADTGGRWLESFSVFQSKGEGKRIVVDMQKGQNQIRVQEVQSGRLTRGQGRQNGQAGVYKVQRQASVKTRRARKRRMQKAGERENAGLLGIIQDELAQRDRKRRDKYTGENK